MRNTLLVALLASVSISALAADPPKPVSNDGLVCEEPYSPDRVTVVHLEVGREVTVELAKDEQITKVPVSDLDALAVTAYEGRNLVWMKPVGTMPPEPVVITSLRPDGSPRVYLLQVDARQTQPGGVQVASLNDTPAVKPEAGARPCYLVRFTYPGDEAAKRAAAAAAARKVRAAKWEAIQNANAFRRDDPVRDNWKYVGVGDHNLAPDHVYDDGFSTFLQYDGNRPVPAPWEVGVDGKDKLLPGFNAESGPCPAFNTPAATCLKLHAVVRKIRLRDREDLGGERPSLEIFNQGFNAIGSNPGTGTSSPDVVRGVKP